MWDIYDILEEMKKRRKQKPLGVIEEDILQHLTAGDMLMSFLMSARSTQGYYREAYKRARARYRYKRSIEGLAARGLVTRNGETLRLTEKGREMLSILASRKQKQGPWRGTWWLVMYDIPVSMNAYRFELRRILIVSGFRKLQQSVWISPFPCSELELFLRNNPKMTAVVRYAEALPFVHLENLADWKKLPAS